MGNYNVKDQGFHGSLYHPETDLYPGKVLIVLGGGDGSFSATQKIAKTFTKGGLTTFAAAYWKQSGLPKILKSVPLEYLEKITAFLKSRGYEKIGLWGISMGAEYVLLAGSLMPELYDCIVAASPICFATQGVVSFTKMANGAAFAFQGKDVPYQPFRQKMSAKRLLKECLHSGEFTVRFMYRDIEKNPKPAAIIPVTKMKASVLLISGGQDAMWPAKESAERIMKALDGSEYPYPHKHLHYRHGSHFTLPLSLKTDLVYRSERKYRKESKKIKADIYHKTMRFLKESW